MLQSKLEIHHHEGQPDVWIPVFCCDWCKQEIITIKNAMFLWNIQGDTNKTTTNLYTCHKGTCNHQMEKHLLQGDPTFLLGWEELPKLLLFLQGYYEKGRIWPTIK